MLAWVLTCGGGRIRESLPIITITKAPILLTPVTMDVQEGKLLDGNIGCTYSALTPPDMKLFRLGISCSVILSKREDHC